MSASDTQTQAKPKDPRAEARDAAAGVAKANAEQKFNGQTPAQVKDTEKRYVLEEEKSLLKHLRFRGQVPKIPECDSPHVPRLKDVQGDVLFRFPKTHERFMFFRIADSNLFQDELQNFAPFVTSAEQVKKNMLDICRVKDKFKELEGLTEKAEAEAKEMEEIVKEGEAKVRELEAEAQRQGVAEELKKNIEEAKEYLKEKQEEAIGLQVLAKERLEEAKKVKNERVHLTQCQIAFSKAGVTALLGKCDTGDERFDRDPMEKNRSFLGDQSEWDQLFDWEVNCEAHPTKKRKDGQPVYETPALKPQPLDGVIIIATEYKTDLEEMTEVAMDIFKSCSFPRGGVLDGNVRPSDNRGHEHFGFLDGISQPAICDIEYPLPGQIEVDPGVIVMGYPGDPVPASKRPSWAKGGTMMAFRKLQQSVLAFETYCKNQGARWDKFIPGAMVPEGVEMDAEKGAELFAARFVGRWKSGAPIALAPYKDDKKLANDPKRNNDFDYTVVGVPGISAQEPSDFYCPFTAHIRKTGPRNLDPYVSRKHLASSAIVRAGIPYGDEVSEQERTQWEAERNTVIDFDVKDRGLLFACYASHLDSGFVRQTTQFGNNDFFPITSYTPTFHGQDTIIGGPPAMSSSNELRKVGSISDKPKRFRYGEQLEGARVTVEDTVEFKVSDGEQVHFEFEAGGETFEVAGQAKKRPVELPAGDDNPYFVTSRGGEYFFVPPIVTLNAWATPLKESGQEKEEREAKCNTKRAELEKDYGVYGK